MNLAQIVAQVVDEPGVKTDDQHLFTEFLKSLDMRKVGQKLTKVQKKWRHKRLYKEMLRLGRTSIAKAKEQYESKFIGQNLQTNHKLKMLKEQHEMQEEIKKMQLSMYREAALDIEKKISKVENQRRVEKERLKSTRFIQKWWRDYFFIKEMLRLGKLQLQAKQMEMMMAQGGGYGRRVKK